MQFQNIPTKYDDLSREMGWMSPRQYHYLHESTASFNLAVGPVRSGKTFSQVMRFINYIDQDCPKGSMLMMTGRNSETLYNNIIRSMVDYLGTAALTVIRSPWRLTYRPKNIEIVCIGANDEADWKRISGSTFVGWLADEITLHPRSFVDMAITRCSAGGRLKFWTCNPDNPAHYIKTDFIDNPDIDMNTWSFTFEDNPTLSTKYVEELKLLYSGVFRQRYIEGRWVGFEGIIFDNWRADHHIVPSFYVPDHWKRWRSIDWGFVAPRHAAVCQWWTEKPAGVRIGNLPDHACLIMYREVYTTGTIVEDFSRMIIEQSGRERYPEAEFADHDETNIATARRYGLHKLQRCEKGEKKSKVDALYSALSRDEVFFMQGARCHAADPKLIEAKVPTCTVEELPIQRWATTRHGEIIKEEPESEYNHGCDAAGYFLLSMRKHTPVMVKSYDVKRC